MRDEVEVENNGLKLRCSESSGPNMLQLVQLDFTPEIEVFYMLFERCHSKNINTELAKKLCPRLHD